MLFVVCRACSALVDPGAPRCWSCGDARPRRAPAAPDRAREPRRPVDADALAAATRELFLGP